MSWNYDLNELLKRESLPNALQVHFGPADFRQKPAVENKLCGKQIPNFRGLGQTKKEGLYATERGAGTNKVHNRLTRISGDHRMGLSI